MFSVKVRLEKNARLPEYKSEHAAGADVFAAADVRIEPGSAALVPTGLFLEIPEGFEAQVRPRSGLALKHGVTLLNSPGTIDADYRGEVKIIMVNHGKQVFEVKKGDRIAQLVIHEVERVTFEEASELKPTKRGEGGFGSTGIQEMADKIEV